MVRLFGYFCCALFLLITSLSCDSSEPLVNSGTNLTLALEDSSSTELWLRLTSSNIPLPISISLNQTDSQNNTVVQNISLCCNDTLLYIDSLLPKQTYKFKAEVTNYQQRASNELTTATMDTTSHNFTWQSWTFGEHSSSVLYDVAIIDENNIWAVGEIFMNDSLGNPDPNAYNAAHWDGSEWKVLRIRYYGSCSVVEFPPLKAIWAFSENNIVVTNGGSIGWFDGSTIVLDCGVNPLLTGAINKIWGTSSKDLFVVGDGGNIAHYGGSSVGWHKIESGTESNISDAWGVPDGNGGFNKYFAADSKMLKINNENELSSIEILSGTFIISLWSKSNNLIYAAGGGFLLYKNFGWEQQNTPELKLIYRVRGQDYNNVAALSANRSVYHFNGFDWFEIPTEPNNVFLKVEIKNNLIVTVGWQGDYAIITLFKRND